MHNVVLPKPLFFFLFFFFLHRAASKQVVITHHETNVTSGNETLEISNFRCFLNLFAKFEKNRSKKLLAPCPGPRSPYHLLNARLSASTPFGRPRMFKKKEKKRKEKWINQERLGGYHQNPPFPQSSFCLLTKKKKICPLPSSSHSLAAFAPKRFGFLPKLLPTPPSFSPFLKQEETKRKKKKKNLPQSKYPEE